MFRADRDVLLRIICFTVLYCTVVLIRSGLRCAALSRVYVEECHGALSLELMIKASEGNRQEGFGGVWDECTLGPGGCFWTGQGMIGLAPSRRGREPKG